MVTLKSTVHDSSVTLLRDALLGDLGIDPFRKAPHLGANLTKLDGSRGVVLDSILECLVEVAIVQEDVGVMVPAVEVALDRLDGLNDTIKLLVSCQNNEGAIGTRLAGVGLETTFDEDLIVLFADFSVRERRMLISRKDRGEVRWQEAYLIAGGAPAGMSIRPGEFGCLTKRMRMRMTTISGNNITTPTGIDMVEFPLRRNGLRKKARRDHRRPDLVLGL